MSRPARARYEMLVTNRSIEIVDLDTAEAILFWDCTRPQLRKMRELIIADLDRLPADEFLAAWAMAEATDFG